MSTSTSPLHPEPTIPTNRHLHTDVKEVQKRMQGRGDTDVGEQTPDGAGVGTGVWLGVCRCRGRMHADCPGCRVWGCIWG